MIPSFEDLLVKGVLVIVAAIAAGETIGWLLTHFGAALGALGFLVIVGRLVWYVTRPRL